jgi:xylan 1,4-beta-xylosidase
MSYWTFTDIFEEAGPRTTPFHGGFGLTNYQDIKKPAYYAFKYLNELGNTELSSTDSSAIICKDANGNLQALVWDFTIDHPGDSVHNQVFYKRNLPAKASQAIHLKIKGLTPGKYEVTIYKTGYQANDPYTAYFKMGSPSQLTVEQVKTIKRQDNNQSVEKQTITIGAAGDFEKQLAIKQNDVLLVKVDKVVK